MVHVMTQIERNAPVGTSGSTSQVDRMSEHFAQAIIPGTEPDRTFATRREAEDHLKRILIERMDHPDSDGDVGFIFESGGRYHLYGPRNLEDYAGGGEVGMHLLGAAYGYQRSAAEHALGEANFVSGGILIHGHFHSLTDNGNGQMQLGQPTRRM